MLKINPWWVSLSQPQRVCQPSSAGVVDKEVLAGCFLCLVVGDRPGEPLLACGMAWVTYHLPGPHWPDGRRGYLDGIVTDAPARGRGYARRIVDELVDWLNGAGIHYIQLHTSQAGRPVYEAAGFVDGRYPGMDLITALRDR
ncbi:hypothetical protein SAM40697_6611 [Streptomyces ambofaciens]|uniref:N-acetyltransferase domain-containing protein n=1 Tax=Streptomyces ambofaciens TaxID=1889 RepID=A0ABM6B9K4_STRAM|nr:hypothetical protein SAM40697_6611 [Streptomyces ambofaciens]